MGVGKTVTLLKPCPDANLDNKCQIWHSIGPYLQLANYKDFWIEGGLLKFTAYLRNHTRTKICACGTKGVFLQLCKAAKHEKHQHWFQLSNPNVPNTRSVKLRYKQPICRLSRFQKSPIPYLTSLLNK